MDANFPPNSGLNKSAEMNNRIVATISAAVAFQQRNVYVVETIIKRRRIRLRLRSALHITYFKSLLLSSGKTKIGWYFLASSIGKEP